MSMVVITIITRSDGGKLVIKKVLHVGRKDATESGVGGGHASKGSDCVCDDKDDGRGIKNSGRKVSEC